MFPFFPLPAHFDALNGESWQTLFENIQTYLVQNPDVELRRQILTREFFWMAFVAAFPTFLFSNWAEWDYRIPVQGNFITYWFDHLDLPFSITYHGNSSEARMLVWQQLAVTVGYHFG